MPQVEQAIVVIGAGMAGLAATSQLVTAGKKVILIEARDRLGGRIHTLRLDNWETTVEGGAEFIHGRPPQIWDLVSKAGLDVSEVAGDDLISSTGTLKPFDMGEVWAPIFDRLRTITETDLTFNEFLARYCQDIPADQKRLATAYVEGFNAAESELISCRWLLESDESSGHGGDAKAYRIPGGYDQLVEFSARQLPSNLDLRLNTVVSRISWRRGAVNVECHSTIGESQVTTIQATQAIVTLPLGVLRSTGQPGGVSFVPDLTEKWKACSALLMGTVVKLALRFKKRFWEPESLGFLHCKEQPFPTWWTISQKVPSLMGWTGGPPARRLQQLSRDEIRSAGIDSLAAALGRDRNEIKSLLADSQLFDWSDDPFARGAYSYVGAGGMEASSRLAESVEDTLFFAGEATHRRLSATVAGAIASGERAAAEVLAIGA